MAQVRILHVDHVSPSRIPSPPLDHVKLSFFDSLWVAFPPIQRLFLYRGDADLPPFPSLLQALKSSLAQTLGDYYPLAGKLTHLADSGDVEIDCSAAAVGAGVAFLEAEAEGDLHRLVEDEAHDVEAFLRLVPGLDTQELPVPVFAVQLTRFAGGGLALGFLVHHAVADGIAVWSFMEAWAAACRSGAGGGGPPPPFHDRAVIKHPRGDEIVRHFLREMSPNLPKRTAARILNIEVEGRLRHARRTFVLDAQSIQTLKQRAMQQRGHSNAPLPSSFVALAAHAWIAFVRSKGLDPADDSCLAFLADCRARLDPPVGEGYFGNCVKGCWARAPVGDLLAEEDGLARACAAIQAAIRDSSVEPLKRVEHWVDDFRALPMARLANVAASPRFKVYETDFGWGRPSRVELVSMNHDGELVFVGARDGNGVQVSVSLNPLHMGAFKANILRGLNA